MRKYIVILFGAGWLTLGCTQLHHVHIGDIAHEKGTPFDLKVSETGVSLEEAAELLSEATESGDGLGDLISLFQFGPTTGKPVFDAGYADGLPDALRRACPSGRVTQLEVTRESANYPVISGEIIKLSGQCLPKKGH